MMRFCHENPLDFGTKIKSNKKIRWRNRVRAFMKLPLTVARWSGVYVPSPKNNVLWYILRIIVIQLLYVSSAVSVASGATIVFSDIVYWTGDVSRAALHLIILVETLRKGKHFVAALKQLDELEQELSILGKPPFTNASIFRTLVARILLTCGIQVGGFLRQCKGVSAIAMVQYTILNVILSYSFAAWYFFVAFLSMVDQQFAFLTRRLVVTPLLTKNNVKAQSKIWEDIRELIKFHFRVCWAVDDASKWFELSFLLFAGIHFYNSTSSFYIMSLGMYSLYQNPNWCDLADSINNVLWVILRIHELWMVLRYCSVAERRSQEFSRRLHQVMVEADKPAKGIFKLHFAMKPKVEIWACGFFRIDNTLAFSMIGAAATYLAVVYQSVDLDGNGFLIKPNTTILGNITLQ